MMVGLQLVHITDNVVHSNYVHAEMYNMMRYSLSGRGLNTVKPIPSVIEKRKEKCGLFLYIVALCRCI